LPVKKHISAMMVVAVMIFAWIAPPIIEACDCASGDRTRPYPPDTPTKTASSQPLSAGCCTTGCPSEPPSDTRFAVVDVRYACDTNAICYCASDNGPQPAVNQSFLNNNHSPSFKEFKFQEALPSAFMSGADPVIPRSILAFERNLARIPPHISSTVLLL
jgi:hypothetical protein